MGEYYKLEKIEGSDNWGGFPDDCPNCLEEMDYIYSDWENEMHYCPVCKIIWIR